MSQPRFAGKHVVVTGATSGIGRAGALKIAREGGVVVATGMTTALGRVASMLQEGPVGRTPLQRRLDGLGYRACRILDRRRKLRR